MNRACAALAALLVLASPCLAVNAQAERLWKSKCASCHGDDGKGQTKMGRQYGVKDFTNPAWKKANSDQQVKASIQNGRPPMSPYKDKLKPDQIDELVAFIRKDL